ncbi:MAG: invasin domain 3-containing protein [bacterium]
MNPRQTINKKIRKNSGLNFVWLFILLYIFIFATNCSAIEIKVGDNELTITWIKPTKNEDGTLLTDLAGYYIYRSEDVSDNFERLNDEPVRGICYTDASVINGVTYSYAVTAVDYSGNESKRSPIISSSPNILPPSRFKVKPGDGEVHLFWDPYEKSELRGYFVYRRSSNSIANTFERITEIPIQDTHYIDNDLVNGIAYFYKVSCVGLDGIEGLHSQEEGATPLSVIPEEPSSVRAQFIQESSGANKIFLAWKEVEEDNIIGYKIYRRLLNETEFTLLTTGDLLRETQYIDNSIQPDKGYLYSVVAVNGNGMESQYPKEAQCFTSALYIASFTQDTGGNAKRAGDKICFCLRGEPGLSAYYKIEDLTSVLPLEETGEGVYTACLDIVDEMSIEEGVAIGFLEDSKGNKTSKQAGERIVIDNQPPDIIKDANVKWDAGTVKITWEPPKGEFTGFEIFRHEEGELKTPKVSNNETLPVEIVSGDKTFCYDASIKPDRSYFYTILTLDRAGNRSDPYSLSPVYIPYQEGIPLIKSVRENTAGLSQKTGDRIEVELTGEEGCTASFFIPGIIERPIPMNETAFGRYSGYYIVGPNDKSERTFIKACLKDDLEHNNCQNTAIDLMINYAAEDINPPVIYSINHNAFNESGFSGKLVPGNKLEVTLEGEARCKAYFIISSSNTSPDMDNNEFNKHELIENQDYPGSYSGAYTIGWKDKSMDEAYVWACMSDRAGNKVWKHSEDHLSLDIRPRIEVKVVSYNENEEDNFDNSGEHVMLSAGEDSRAEITVKVTNANREDPAEGHIIAFTITTTDEYTGVVGGGDLRNRMSTDIGLDFDHTTDSWGEVDTLYTSGEAAKTAIIVAKDLTTGHSGVSYILNVLKAQIAIELKQPASLGKTLELLPYKLMLTANPDRLTADGVSSSWITAQITDRDGRPVEKAGVEISFFSSGGGTISPSHVYTDNLGQASTRYTAGIIRGTDIVTGDCVDLDAESGEVTIALMSDAPAKMVLSADPDSLYANGINTSNIKVRVLDKNENSVQEAIVNFFVNTRWKDMQVKQDLEDKGRLSVTTIPTDFNGWSECTYTTPDLTGLAPAVATIFAKIVSRVPTEEEIARAVGTIFVPILYPEMEEDEEVKILEWLFRKGDEINEGDPVVRIATQKGEYFLNAPVSGELVKIIIYKGESVKLGQTIGQILADEEYWEEFYD